MSDICPEYIDILLLKLFIRVCILLVSVRTGLFYIRLTNFDEVCEAPAPVSINAQHFTPWTLTIPTGYVTVLLYVVNTAIYFLSQIQICCLPL